MSVDDTGTLLVLTGMGIPLYSAQGAKQSLSPIEAAGKQRRSVNGTLYDLSLSQFQKYRSSIRCTAQVTPAIDGVWQGRVLTVECAAELATATGNTLQRSAVSGSTRTEDGFDFYRPILEMQVTRFTSTFNEWEATYDYEIDLEEI